MDWQKVKESDVELLREVPGASIEYPVRYFPVNLWDKVLQEGVF